MPIYEYRCGDCGHIFDALQKMSDDPLKQCPECNENALKKLMSAPKFRLKGSGWYETDFKTGDKRNIADSGSSSSKSTESKSSDSKSKSTDTKSKSTDTKKAAD
jgi:putative FmdB family regulatory protein